VSIAVGLDELEQALADRPWGYVITISDRQQTRLLAVPTRLVDGVLLVEAGGGTAASAAARPDVTMVFPPASGTEYSLIVDGRADVGDGTIRITPTNAVLHRPAL
jgi:hypothetical protein